MPLLLNPAPMMIGRATSLTLNNIQMVARLTECPMVVTSDGAAHYSPSWEILDVLAPPEARAAWLKGVVNETP